MILHSVGRHVYLVGRLGLVMWGTQSVPRLAVPLQLRSGFEGSSCFRSCTASRIFQGVLAAMLRPYGHETGEPGLLTAARSLLLVSCICGLDPEDSPSQD